MLATSAMPIWSRRPDDRLCGLHPVLGDLFLELAGLHERQRRRRMLILGWLKERSSSSLARISPARGRRSDLF